MTDIHRQRLLHGGDCPHSQQVVGAMPLSHPTGLFAMPFFQTVKWVIFTRDSICVYATAIASIRPSVRHMRAFYQNGLTTFTRPIWYAHHSSFSSPRVVA